LLILEIKKIDSEGESSVLETKEKVVSNETPSSFFPRSIAYLIDSIILYIISIFILSPLIHIGMKVLSIDLSGPEFQLGFVSPLTVFFVGSVTTIFEIITVIIYFGWFYRNKKASPGKLLFNLKILNEKNEHLISYPIIFLREVILKLGFFQLFSLTGLFLFSFAFTWFIVLSISIFVSKNHRGLHDQICNTKVLLKNN